MMVWGRTDGVTRVTGDATMATRLTRPNYTPVTDGAMLVVGRLESGGALKAEPVRRPVRATDFRYTLYGCNGDDLGTVDAVDVAYAVRYLQNSGRLVVTHMSTNEHGKVWCHKVKR